MGGEPYGNIFWPFTEVVRYCFFFRRWWVFGREKSLLFWRIVKDGTHHKKLKDMSSKESDAYHAPLFFCWKPTGE